MSPDSPHPTAHIISYFPLSVSLLFYASMGVPGKGIWKSGLGQFTILSLFILGGWYYLNLLPLLWESRLVNKLVDSMVLPENDKVHQNPREGDTAMLIRQRHLSKWLQTLAQDSDYLGSKPGPSIHHLSTSAAHIITRILICKFKITTSHKIVWRIWWVISCMIPHMLAWHKQALQHLYCTRYRSRCEKSGSKNQKA